MAAKCPVCGGATTCPAGGTITILGRNDIRYINSGDPVPPGWIITHRRKRYIIAVPFGTIIVGAAQSDRILAHYPYLRRVWVGPCSYTFVREENQNV